MMHMLFKFINVQLHNFPFFLMV